jgi:hypothetical protein
MRRVLALAISLPMMVAGGLGAHWLAYLLASPEAGVRRTLLLATGHAYQTRLPVVLGALGGISLVLVLALIARRGSLVARLRLSPTAFLALPLAGFAIQEVAERASVGFPNPWHVWLEPTFWRGALLQVPFGLAALLVATLLLRAAAVVERTVRRRRRAPLLPTTAFVSRVVAAGLVRPAERVRMGDALRFRGPPRVASILR